MNTQQLKCFIAVSERLNFTKASEMLFLSVPTVTHHVKSLEYELGTTLFIRDKHQVSLTNEGKKFYNEAIKIMQIEDNFKKDLNKENKTIKIICTSYNELNLITKIFSNLPQYKPEIHVKNYSEALYELKHLNCDGMLGSDNMLLEDKDLILKASKKVTSYLILKKDHPLSQKKKIYFKDLENETIIRLNNILIPFYSRNKIKDLINIHTGRNNDLICDDEQIALSMIMMNQGVSIIPEYRIPKYLNEELTIRNIEEDEPFDYGLIINPINSSSCIDDVIDSFKKVIKNYKFNDDIL